MSLAASAGHYVQLLADRQHIVGVTHDARARLDHLVLGARFAAMLRRAGRVERPMVVVVAVGIAFHHWVQPHVEDEVVLGKTPHLCTCGMYSACAQ